jgi:hypothetical protein
VISVMHQLKEMKVRMTPFTDFYNKFWRKLTSDMVAIMGSFSARVGKDRIYTDVGTNR